MASVIFSTDQVLFDMFTAAACNIYGWPANVPDPNNAGQMIPNPVTSGAFATQVIINFAKDITRVYQGRIAAEAAQVAAVQQVDTQINSTPITVTVQ